jgi:hypothetical protein
MKAGKDTGKFAYKVNNTLYPPLYTPHITHILTPWVFLSFQTI